MTDEKPLHVRVAEALGWTECRPCGDIAAPWASGYEGRPNGEPYIIGDERAGWRRIPRFDLEWKATGPLIEKYEITVARGRFFWHATRWTNGIQDAYGEAGTPLIAVCNLILALKEAGRL